MQEGEERALIEKIIVSRDFGKTDGQDELLRWLYENRAKRFQAKGIEEQFYKNPIDGPNNKPGHSRERIMNLRERLETVQGAKSWRNEIKVEIEQRGEGYQLVFKQESEKQLATELFWGPYLEAPQDIRIITNTHLFFYEPELNYAFRYGDLDYDERKRGHRKTPLEMLEDEHQEAVIENLQPIYRYLSEYEVLAFEKLQQWFFGRSGVLLERRVSQEFADEDIHDVSPVLLGRPGANRFIGQLYVSSDTKHLAYRFEPPMGTVRIKGTQTEREKKALLRFDPKHDTVFGIVARLPNPGGGGSITMISAEYYSRAVMQMVSALTDDRRLERLFNQMEWPLDAEVPESFEMLFAVRVSPGNIEGAGHAELLCWRANAA